MVQVYEKRTGLILLALQVVLIVIFGIFGTYGDNERQFDSRYPLFQGVHVMIFIGFGFLMTFLQKYGYSAVGLTFLLSALALQWAVVAQGLLSFIKTPSPLAIPLDLDALINGDFAAAAVLISFGAVLGKTSPLQLIFMTMIEVAVYSGNLYIGQTVLQATDAGGSMFIHAFGAYFGLTVALMVRGAWQRECEAEASLYHADLFSLIGTIFLWISWPSFNAALLEGPDEQRAVINTYCSLAACVLASFALSLLLSPSSPPKFNMVHIQNATLAGGVGVGTMANFDLGVWGAMVVGLATGVVSVLGFHYLSPFLSSRCHLHDTCGVHNLHGMPAVFAGIGGIVSAGISVEGAKVVEGRSGLGQAGYQAAALSITLGMAVAGGAVTGLIMRYMSCLSPPAEDKVYSDAPYWETASDFPGSPPAPPVGFGNPLHDSNPSLHSAGEPLPPDEDQPRNVREVF